MEWPIRWLRVQTELQIPVIWHLERGIVALWAVIFMTLGVGDTITTIQGILVMGGTEANPLIDLVLTRYGAIGLVLVKGITLPIIFGSISLQLKHSRKAAYISSILVALMGCVVTANNAYQILAV